jgi:hypothetical protein
MAFEQRARRVSSRTYLIPLSGLVLPCGNITHALAQGFRPMTATDRLHVITENSPSASTNHVNSLLQTI